MNLVGIKCRGIKKTYGENETPTIALRGIDLDVEMGKLTVLAGPSGSGKTTLLSIITHLLKPDEGKVLLLGHDLSEIEEKERAKFCNKNLGIIFQNHFLIPTLTVAENISLPLLISGESQKAVEEKTMKLLKTMKLHNRSDESPTHLSQGEQQRVAIARAIINDPQIIVCDEPTSFLDQVAGSEMMAILKNFSTQFEKLVLIVTHDARVFHFADRMLYINDGQLREQNA